MTITLTEGPRCYIIEVKLEVKICIKRLKLVPNMTTFNDV